MEIIKINHIHTSNSDVNNLTMDILNSLESLEKAVLDNCSSVWTKFEEFSGVFSHYANNEHQIMNCFEVNEYSQKEVHLDDHEIVFDEIRKTKKREHVPRFLVFFEVWLNQHINRFNQGFAEELDNERRNMNVS